MNSILSFFAAPLIAVQIIMLAPSSDKPCKQADLTVVEISQPHYNSEIDGTEFEVVIKNQGKAKSTETILKTFDLDIGYEEAKQTIKDKTTLSLIQENNQRAIDYGQDVEVDKDTLDYDFYWEIEKVVKALEPGEEIRVFISIENHWIYDSNCEIRAIVNPENTIKDCDNKNNQLDFYGWG